MRRCMAAISINWDQRSEASLESAVEPIAGMTVVAEEPIDGMTVVAEEPVDDVALVMASDGSTNEQPTSVEATTLLLALFYRSNLTQDDFQELISVVQLLSPHEIPVDYNSCIKLISADQDSEYQKTWFCNFCLKFVTISKSQRRCLEWENR